MRNRPLENLTLGVLALAAMLSLFFGVAHAGGPISGVNLTTTDTGVTNALLSSSPVTRVLDVAGYNHVVFTIPMTDTGAATVLNMTCLQSPDSAVWTPVPACESTASYTLTCGPRIWKWPAATQGRDATFYVPVNAAALKCRLTGTTPVSTRVSILGYRANL